MNPASPPPPLPQPQRTRWQPLRLGLVEMFHYDSEEFWFHDGRLLLRGNNGTGKSKVLSLSLPFLLDGYLYPARIEPDGDPNKKMAWNLLLNRHERRTGYTWIEFGRRDDDGTPHYLTLGCGMAASAGRASPDSWFFLVEHGRIGSDLWLLSPSRVVLGREHLREALTPFGGQVLTQTRDYRRAVDERLFHLGTARYGALMDTLIQLRQPQLSKKPDEHSLSQALTESLPPLPDELLGDVADALNQLEEYRRELAEYEALAHAVEQFNRRYQRYAATQSRRQAAQLRSAQTDFDHASRAVNAQREAFDQARSAEADADARLADNARSLVTARARLDTLRDDPANASARQLDHAQREAQRRSAEVQTAQQRQQDAETRHTREKQASQQRIRQLADLAHRLGTLRQHTLHAANECGLGGEFSASPLARSAPVELEGSPLDRAHDALRHELERRREHVAQLLRQCDALDRASDLHALAHTQREEARDDAETAAAASLAADEAVQAQTSALLAAWQQHFDGLRQMHVDGAEADRALEQLALWCLDLDGDNPARLTLDHARTACMARLAQRTADLATAQQRLDDEQHTLHAEQAELRAGADRQPPVPHWRAADTRAPERAGAPLWQLVDFQPRLDADARAGLEAALQASGLLDAWINPDGSVHTADGAWPHDSHWQARPPQQDSLADWLCATPTAHAQVSEAHIERLLTGIACSPHEHAAAEAWLSPDGRFRLGALAGAWHKPAAEFIGHAARAAARERRLQQIATRLHELAAAAQTLDEARQQLAHARQHAQREWQDAPGDGPLRAAHSQADTCARNHAQARQRLEHAEQRWRDAATALEQARQTLLRDAVDMGLPDSRDALQRLGPALATCAAALPGLVACIRETRTATHEQQQQREREEDAAQAVRAAHAEVTERQRLADEAQTQWQTLQEAVGATVETLQRRLSEARAAVATGEAQHKQCELARRTTAEQRAAAEQQHRASQATLNERAAARQLAITRLQDFAATGLLATALPELEQPSPDTPWTIEPALQLARRTEQALTHVRDDDDAWDRIQNQISQDFNELGRTLTALSHQAQAEASEFGFVVSIVYQNRPERPDRLCLRLADEIAQRRELLTAGEREVLENHLQAEIAATVQTLLREAEKQIGAINAELEKRPTSTGVRFRLQWQTLSEQEGAPVGLDAARRRLLNTSSDLWSAEDRRVVGDMLQQRIATERSRADLATGGSLHEQLARALDYRRWHRFRVQRWQDRQWRPLSGPASSGERALGLTVPLFAAVASFYSQADTAHAPRLVLLDEAFAGIDDDARAHCWALIREFDLDFVITSEREWACSAELPGVAIAQLQRRENVDAVHVSRWLWDGRVRQREADPERRFPPRAAASDDDA